MRLIVAALAGCAPEALLPSLDLSGDAMVATFPPDTTLLAGADRPEGAAWERVSAAFGLAQVVDARRARVGCFDEGCVGLLEGDLDVTRLGGVPRARGVDLRAPWGALVVRTLAPGKVVAGDRAAVARVAAEQADRLDGLDPAAWSGVVPVGDVWVAARGRDALDMLAERLGERLPEEADDVRSAALAATVDGLVRLRVVTDKPAAVAALARRELDRRGLAGQVVRVGDVVDVEVAP